MRKKQLMTRRLRGLKQRIATRKRLHSDDGNMAPILLKTNECGPRRAQCAYLNRKDINDREKQTAMNRAPKPLLNHENSHLTKQHTKTKRSTSSLSFLGGSVEYWD